MWQLLIGGKNTPFSATTGQQHHSSDNVQKVKKKKE
jgi:hypothetical protein